MSNIRAFLKDASAIAPLRAGFTKAAKALDKRLTAPIIFKQIRYGQHGEPFTIYKFRTMAHPAAGQEGYEFDNQRVSKVGRFLRRYGLDELPQIINVLKGDMNIIGPRPIPQKMPKHLSEVYNYKPGMFSPKSPTPLRRITPDMTDFHERLDAGVRLEIEWMKTKTPLKTAKLFVGHVLAVIQQDHSGAKPPEDGHNNQM